MGDDFPVDIVAAGIDCEGVEWKYSVWCTVSGLRAHGVTVKVTMLSVTQTI